MRNPERIDEILSVVEEIWKLFPDLRFNQLITVLQIEFTEENPAYLNEYYSRVEHLGTILLQRETIPDLFYVEDDRFLEFLHLYYAKVSRGKQ